LRYAASRGFKPKERTSLKIPDWGWLKTTSQNQLEIELAPLEIFLANYLKTATDPAKVQIAQYSQSLTQAARAQLAKRRVQDAWALFYSAELEEYKLMDANEINARAGKILYVDTEVLSDGAKQNVRRLIGVDSGNGDWKLKNPPNQDDVIEARRTVQSYYNDKYINLGLSMQQLSILATIALILSVLIISTLTKVPNAISVTEWLFWLTIGLLGAAGGTISGLLGLQAGFALKGGMPERLLNKWITIAKPIVGFAAAIIIAIFIIGGLVQVADITISNYLIYAMAFVSGFSERLIIGAVTSRLPT
jgi:hypothetical protein